MVDFIEECKKWIILIQKLDLETIVSSLQKIKKIKHNEDHDKYLFKFLLHLSHCADKCHKEKLSKEIEIFTIANFICENLTNIPCKNKLFSALYYIVYYLLNKQCFEEAKVINSYLFPGRILHVDDGYESTKYFHTASLWNIEIFKILDKLIANLDTKTGIIDEQYCSYIKYHLQILKYCDENLGYTFKTVEAYIKKLVKIPLVISFPCLLQLFKHLLNYINNLKTFPISEAYNLLINMVATAFYKRDDALNNPNILNYFRQCDAYFLETLRTSSQCYNCYKLFREYTINLFETNYMSTQLGELRFNKCSEILDILMQKYGKEDKTLIETLTAVSLSYETLFANWESLVAKQLINTSISIENIVNMGNFVKIVFNIIKNRPLSANYTCKKCPESAKCVLKKDMYNASVATVTFVRVVSKLNSDILSEPIFLLAKELLEDLVLVFNEIDKTGCDYSNPMWDLCGRTIFNIGIISETKYPAHLEGLYETLCKQVVQRDGLNSKISSFGLENPVGTALHRLSVSTVNQEKYRKALSYTAYNALLSNQEVRKKKAFDTWASIKLKVIDSKELQELTIVKCLEMDRHVVKELGIDVNLEEYDCNDMYVRELKALFQVKGNVLLSMKKSLAELESASCSLQYAQGVLLLCFHVLQLSKREFISEYIAKAIKNLKSCKPKTLGNQCLLANLYFFNIVEKLYVRSQTIKKQIDDANFTMKAFKILNGQVVYDEEKEDEVVPTYGGISIEEDKKCAKELRDVLTMWTKCLQDNVSNIVNDWEPKFTLETIVIFGEYCRLYKFVHLEETAWKLAYTLATALQDHATCTYVTSRSLSLKRINIEWIDSAKVYAENNKASSKAAEADIVALFWLSLAEFYLDCKKVEEAKELLEKVKTMPNYQILYNSKIYILSTRIKFSNYFILNKETSQEEYCQLLVEMHYSMLNLHELVEENEIHRFWQYRFHLFACEQVFETMFAIAIPMNSLLSYREVSAHLIAEMKLAQKFGLTLRIAQFLKYFCYIDLLRMQLEECETRLQDLEHILCLEHFQASMKLDFKEKKTTQSQGTERLREAPSVELSKNCASPELKKKSFSKPEFIAHSTCCQCFICTNLHYHYLAFSATHLRGQLYSLLKYSNEAELHFEGAFDIKQRIDERDSAISRRYKNYEWRQDRHFITDYILYLLDCSMFITCFNPEKKEDALALIEESLDVAAKNDLSKHCVSVAASELYFQHHFYQIFDEKLSICVPQDIPITITNQPADGCITPKQQIEKVTRNQRRRKSPPALGIPVITIDNSDKENSSSNTLTTEVTAPKVKPIKQTNTRTVRRKILIDEIEEGANNVAAKESGITIRRSTRLAKSSDGSKT